MTQDLPPWEPPIAGTDAEQIVGSLDRMRATFRWKADDLDADGLSHRVGVSALTLGDLLAHLALVEDHYFTHLIGRQDYPSIWGERGHDGSPDWAFQSSAGSAPAELYALYDDAVGRSRRVLTAALESDDLDQRIDLGQPDRQPSLRAVLCSLIEEYGRHTGHADLLRESVDGRVGEDPPADWRPPQG